MRRASAPATLSTRTKPPPPPPPATWALRRASKAAAQQTKDVAEALVVREVLAECIDDVAQAHHENEVNELKDLVDDQSLRLEVIAGEERGPPQNKTIGGRAREHPTGMHPSQGTPSAKI